MRLACFIAFPLNYFFYYYFENLNGLYILVLSVNRASFSIEMQFVPEQPQVLLLSLDL